MRQLRSAQVTQGVERAPARSLFYAMGYTKEELDRPLIGVVSAHSEIVPGHFNLDKITEAVKAGNPLHEDNRLMCEAMTGLNVVACVKDGDMDLDIPFELMEGFYEENGGNRK